MFLLHAPVGIPISCFFILQEALRQRIGTPNEVLTERIGNPLKSPEQKIGNATKHKDRTSLNMP